MTHFKVEIQLPLYFNPEKGIREKVPLTLIHETYYGLLDLAGGINVSPQPIFGAWKCPETDKKYFDKCLVFTVLVESEDKMTISNVEKVKQLISYKKVLKKRFKQKEIFMVATRCIWL
ncbi:MAG: hypothetical protein ABIF40_02305 [archaeon]